MSEADGGMGYETASVSEADGGMGYETASVSEADGEMSDAPLTRMEFRRAMRQRRRSQRRARRVRRAAVAFFSLVVASGLGGAGYLVWQQFFELTPARYASEVKPVVESANRTVSSVSTLVQQIYLDDVPTAYQVLQARRARASFRRCSSSLAAIAAPRSSRMARDRLIAGCRYFSDAMGLVVQAGGMYPLVDEATLASDIEQADASWEKGASAVGIQAPTIPPRN
jgi:hypothetical protein